MNEELKQRAKQYLADATAKLAGLPAAIAAEAEAAREEGRMPYPIVAHSEVHPSVIAPLLEGIKEPRGPIAETVGVLKRTCRMHPTSPFVMRSDQLAAVLELAGITNA